MSNKDDCISRQAAIDALAKFVPYAICDESTESYTNGLTDAYYLILQLPSVQPDHVADTGRKVEQTGETAQSVQDEDLISRKAAIEAINGMIDRFERILADIRESKGDDSVCGMCEYDGAYMGQSGDWCNECPGFDKDDCFKLSDRCRKRWMGDIVLPSAQPEIIRCKDCDWWTKQEDSVQGRCELMRMYPAGGWYCGNARRRPK